MSSDLIWSKFLPSPLRRDGEVIFFLPAVKYFFKVFFDSRIQGTKNLSAEFHCQCRQLSYFELTEINLLMGRKLSNTLSSKEDSRVETATF